MEKAKLREKLRVLKIKIQVYEDLLEHIGNSYLNRPIGYTVKDAAQDVYNAIDNMRRLCKWSRYETEKALKEAEASE